MSAPGGICSRGVSALGGCLLPGGVVSAPRGCLLPGGSDPGRSAPSGGGAGGCIPACTEADTPPPVDRILDTRF